MYEEITRYLQPSARSDDKTALTKWYEGLYSTEACKRAIMKNNHFPSDYNLDTGLFERWIYSLGWRRSRP